MRNFLAALCIASLLFNSVALAGGLSRGLVAKTGGAGKLAEFVGKAKQVGTGLLLAGLFTCVMLACAKDEAADALPKAENRVATLNYEPGASLDEIIANLEQIEGAQVGIVKSSEQGMLTIETDKGTVYLQLSEGEVLVNNGESPLKVTLSEEVVDEGWIAAGSLIAVIPAALIAGGVLFLTGWASYEALVFQDSWREAVITTGIGLFVTAAMGLGTYHLLILP